MNRDVLRHGETGFLPSTDREWVEVLDTLLGDPALARRIGAAGRAVVERSYSLPVVSRRLVELVTEAAA
jgi:glycosyltransferase involved in cell wall biosynthesis